MDPRDEKPGMYESWGEAVRSLGPLILLSIFMWVGIYMLVKYLW